MSFISVTDLVCTTMVYLRSASPMNCMNAELDVGIQQEGLEVDIQYAN